MPMTRNASAFVPRLSKSACNTYAATRSPIATIRPNVGIDSGPKCKNGIMFFGLSSNLQQYTCPVHSSLHTGDQVKREAQKEPDGERDPFRPGKMPRKNREELHEQQYECHSRARGSDQACSRIFLHKDKRSARRQPPESRSHRADFCYRHEQRITKRQSDSRHDGNRTDRDVRRLEASVNRAERPRNRAAASERKQQPARRNEIAVEALKQSKKGHRENDAHGPFCAK